MHFVAQNLTNRFVFVVLYVLHVVCLSECRLSRPDPRPPERLASATRGTGESVCCHGDDGKIEFVPAAPSTRPFPGDWYLLHSTQAGKRL